MARYSYTAEKTGGEIYKGLTEAADRFQLYQIIRQEGGRLIEFEEELGSNNIFTFAYWNAKIATIPDQEKILFSRNLGSMIEAGLPLSRALSVIMRQTRNTRFKITIAEVGAAVRRGDALHDALAKFPGVFS